MTGTSEYRTGSRHFRRDLNPTVSYTQAHNLNAAQRNAEMKGYLTAKQVDGILFRRDLIVKHFDRLICVKGRAGCSFSRAKTTTLLSWPSHSRGFVSFGSEVPGAGSHPQ